MSSHSIAVRCANCGAKLDVFNDIERFACGYCGASLLVDRRGGIVALRMEREDREQYDDEGARVPNAELLARYAQELEEARKEWRKLTNRRDFRTGAIVAGTFGTVCGLVVTQFAARIGLASAAVSLAIGASAWKKMRTPDEAARITECELRIIELERKISNRNRSADD